MSNEITLTTNKPQNIDYRKPFELSIKDSNGVELKTKAFLTSTEYHLDGFRIPYYNYTFEVTQEASCNNE